MKAAVDDIYRCVLEVHEGLRGGFGITGIYALMGWGDSLPIINLVFACNTVKIYMISSHKHGNTTLLAKKFVSA